MSVGARRKMFEKKSNSVTSMVRTVFPQFVLLLPPLRQSLGALLQRLDEYGLGDLQRWGVRLPQLNVEFGKGVADHRGIAAKSAYFDVRFLVSRISSSQVSIILYENLRLHREDFFQISADDSGQSHFANLLQLV